MPGPTYGLAEAADLLGVSVDTVRRSVDRGEIAGSRSPQGHRVVAGDDLASYLAQQVASRPTHARSTRNQFSGIVTAVKVDGVMAQVELAAGQHRIVSLMTREAAEDLGLRPGVRAAAAVKATNVHVEMLPQDRRED